MSAKKIRSAVTDTGREVTFDPVGKPGVSNLLTIYAALSGRGMEELVTAYEGKGYGDLKKDLAAVVADFAAPVQARTQGLPGRPGATGQTARDRCRKGPFRRVGHPA